MNLLIALLALVPPQEAAPAVIEAGPLTCEVHISRTAHLFHVVDQLAEWSPYCHRQYGRHFGGDDGSLLSDEDRSMLDRHAAVRSERGWGAGLEQTFYTPLDLEAALKLGVEKKHLDEYQAKIEREVLTHFAPRVDKLLRAERPRLNAFAKRLKEYAPRLKDFATQASRLFGDAKHTLPIHLIANPADHDMGGGYNGERLTLEIPRKSDAFPTLLHEVFHAFLFPRMKELEKAAEGVKGLDAQTMNEGLAYAISPGLFHNSGPKADPLALRVREYRAAGASLEDSYARFHMFGLALRPLVKEALEKEGETFERLLPRAVDAWRVLAELAKADSAKRDYRTDPTPSAFIFGPAWQAAQERAKPLNRHCFTRNHVVAHYDEMFKANDKPGDLVILLLSLSSPERVPDAYRDVLPKPWAEIEAALKKGETVELEGQWRKMRTVILAAPTTEDLEKLIRKTDRIR